jgi:hypothetical protein
MLETTFASVNFFLPPFSQMFFLLPVLDSGVSGCGIGYS